MVAEPRVSREMAEAWVETYRRVWQSWDLDGWAAMFSSDAYYVEHPVDEIVVGTKELVDYLVREQQAEGTAHVVMGVPMIDGDQVFAEFWVHMDDEGAKSTLSGCFVARLDPSSGACTHYRQYWFELPGHPQPFPTWGRGGLSQH